MPNSIRPTAATELKQPLAIIASAPYGWWALHTALAHAAQLVTAGHSSLESVALAAIHHVASVGFVSREDDKATRYLGMPIMAFQDALFSVNELPEWRFPDDLLLVTWMVECGGPAMGRGPARAQFQAGSPEHYIGGSRGLFNSGHHGNGPGWPLSRQWSAGDCRYMAPR